MLNLFRPARVRLPDGREVVCSSRHEALLVYDEVGHYVRHGMSLRPGDVVFDVGANIGLFSLWAHEACRRDCTILAFEPLPPVFAMADANLRALGDPRVRALPFGLSSRAGRATFSFHPNATFASTAFPDAGDLEVTRTLMARSLDRLPPPLHLTRHLPAPLRRGVVDVLSRVVNVKETVDCELRTLSQVMRDEAIERVDFLKVDVEKSELEVLRGIEEGDWARVRQAFVEVHDRDGRAATVRELFERHGFRVVVEQDAFFEGTEIVGVSAMRDP